MGLFTSVIWAEPLPFKPPFAVKDAVIVDQDGKKVKLWGVNYLAPFNHNFVNIRQSGVELQTAIDADLAHFKLMGIDFIRVHLYDREITDNQGHLIDNDHLKAFDYLVERACQNGIFMMLTPTVWWNTVENEKNLAERYAFWDLTQYPAFGFSNFFPKTRSSGIRKPSPASSAICAGCSATSTRFQKNVCAIIRTSWSSNSPTNRNMSRGR